MASGNGRRVPRYIYLVAGLEMGTLGGLAMIVWLAVYSALRLRSAWAFANLLGTAFYGERALDRGFGAAALAGSALQVILAGVAGMVFALWGGRLGKRVLLVAVLWGAVWYYLSFRWLWNHWNPLVLLYSPDRTVLLGHLLLGICLAGVPRAARDLAGGAQDSPGTGPDTGAGEGGGPPG
jgi:hypothetical protein